MWEADIRRITVSGQPGQKFVKPHLNRNKKLGVVTDTYLLSE
jgi:hypothetical protein